jgi:V8-like Glu-specific endopeptidase
LPSEIAQLELKFRGHSMQVFFANSVKSFVIILSCASGLLLTGCDNGGSKSSNGGATVIFGNKAELDNAVATYGVRCDGECPKTAGVLLSSRETTLSSCSFTLVGKDIILTNRHCLAAEIAYANADCSKAITAIFMENGKKTYHECARVIAVPSDYKKEISNGRDFAFLRLKSSPDIEPVTIDHSGIEDGEVLTAVTATPWADYLGNGSTLIRKTCTTHMNSIANPVYINSKSPTITLKGCHMVHGNSGSGLLNAHGDLKAIMQSMYDTEKKAPDANDMSLNAQAVRAGLKGLYSISSNAACFDAPTLNISAKRNGCDLSGQTYNSSSIFSKDQEKGLTEIVDKIQKEMNDNSRAFEFEQKAGPYNEKTAKVIISFEPKCIKQSANENLVNYNEPLFEVALSIDSNVRAVANTNITYQAVSLNLPTETIKANPRGEFAVTGSKNLSLKLCK